MQVQQRANPILLVEDDDAVAEVVSDHLEAAGYPVTREADGRKALAVASTQPLQMLLLDLMLPGIDGLDICRQLRVRKCGIPILILSARGNEVERVLGLESGADDYLAKPFSMRELTARVRALLRRVASHGEGCQIPELRQGALTLNAMRREASWREQPLALTLREFDLLHFLARHPGEVFSRGELLHRVWGAGYDGYDHTVNSHLNRLRQKLAQLPDSPPARLIETVWGMGYRLDAGAVQA